MAAAVASPSYGGAGMIEGKLYVASLPSDIEEEELRKVFGVYGRLADVFINRPSEMRSERSAFIRYEEPDASLAAQLVLSEMYKFRKDDQQCIMVSPASANPRGAKGCGKDGGGYGGPAPPPTSGANVTKPISSGGGGCSGVVSPPPPPAPAAGGAKDARLWVGNLPNDVTQEALQNVLGSYGRLTEVNILPSKSNSGQLCGFVNFSTSQEADACVQAMRRGHGFEMRAGEGELKVERPSDRKGGGKGYSSGYGSNKGGKGYYKPY